MPLWALRGEWGESESEMKRRIRSLSGKWEWWESEKKLESEKKWDLTNCYCEQESSCGFVARRENTHRVDDRNDPVLVFAIIIFVMILLVLIQSSLSGWFAKSPFFNGKSKLSQSLNYDGHPHLSDGLEEPWGACQWLKSGPKGGEQTSNLDHLRRSFLFLFRICFFFKYIMESRWQLLMLNSWHQF